MDTNKITSRAKLEEMMKQFCEAAPPEFRSTAETLTKFESRLLEIKLPKIMWDIVARGLKAALEKGDYEERTIDEFYTDQIISKMFLPTSAEHAEILFGSMREIISNTVITNMFDSLTNIMKEEEKRKEKGYE